MNTPEDFDLTPVTSAESIGRGKRQQIDFDWLEKNMVSLGDLDLNPINSVKAARKTNVGKDC